MNRKLSLFFIISFLGMQIFTSLHISDYGFDEHEHNGNICQVYLHCEHTEYGTSSATIALQVPEYFTFNSMLSELELIYSESYNLASPRAPPVFSSI